MEYFLDPKVVEYACGCGLLNPLTKLYFCRHCLKLRCGFCVNHEVDSNFCSNCLENIPSSEAKLKKNRCNSCFDCPSCSHTLSVRATSVTGPMKSETKDGGEESESSVAASKTVTRKMYYLACLACRWTTRDVGIPDQTSATNSWPEPEYSHATRFAMLLEHYQAVVLYEKQEKVDYLKRKAPKQQKFPSLTDRTGLTVSSIRRQLGLTDKTSVQKPKAKPSSISPSVASDVVDELPDDIFTMEINLKNITTIDQRLAQPASQPETVNLLYPQHKSLSIKRSLRCRQCEHNVIKPEYNPGSIKYRIQLFASYHVPEVRFVRCDPLKAGSNSYVTLKIINPTINDMTITIMDLPTVEEEQCLIEETRKNLEQSLNVVAKSSALTPSLLRTTLTEDPRIVDRKTTGKLELPDSSFVINQRDDSAEFDDDIQTEKQDPKFVVWRKANKVAVRILVTPDKDLMAHKDVVVGFTMQYTYVNTATPDKKDPQKHALTCRVYINAGKIAAVESDV